MARRCCRRVIAGLGIADLPDFIVGDAIASGEVEVILKGWHQPEGAVHLVTPPGGPRPARVEVLAEFLMKQFAKGRSGNSREAAFFTRPLRGRVAAQRRGGVTVSPRPTAPEWRDRHPAPDRISLRSMRSDPPPQGAGGTAHYRQMH